MSNDRLYAVTYINFFDNELETTFVITSGGEIEALHLGIRTILARDLNYRSKDPTGFEECKTLEEAKEQALNMDTMIDVVLYEPENAAKAS